MSYWANAFGTISYKETVEELLSDKRTGLEAKGKNLLRFLGWTMPVCLGDAMDNWVISAEHEKVPYGQEGGIVPSLIVLPAGDDRGNLLITFNTPLRGWESPDKLAHFEQWLTRITDDTLLAPIGLSCQAVSVKLWGDSFLTRTYG